LLPFHSLPSHCFGLARVEERGARARRVLIASIMEEYDRPAWEQLIARCEAAGVDGFEINFSCPHGMPERRMGMAMGQDCELLREVCGWINAKATVPVWAKMTPNITCAARRPRRSRLRRARRLVPRMPPCTPLVLCGHILVSAGSGRVCSAVRAGAVRWCLKHRGGAAGCGR